MAIKNDIFNETEGFNGIRLKCAREYKGLTVAELAEKINMQRQTVSMYENMKFPPKVETVINIANILGFKPEYFYQEDKMNSKEGSTYFRALLTTSKKYRLQQIQKVKYIANIHEFLSEYVNFPKLNLPDVNDMLGKSIEEKAMYLREFWGLGIGPINNLVYIVESNGIPVITFDAPTEKIDAFSHLQIVNNEEKYFIAYSANKTSATRIHFTLAHELGHIVMHEWSEDVETLEKDEFNKIENEANEFASIFLLPAETFGKDVSLAPKDLKYYEILKKKWRVSISAMIRRAYNLNFLSYDDYVSLNIKMQKKGIKKVEPLDNILKTSPPSLIKTAVQILIDNNVFSPQEFLNKLSYEYNLPMQSTEIEELLNLPENTLKIDNVIQIQNITLK